jgi:MtN3 and saliva related transmembrane protein
MNVTEMVGSVAGFLTTIAYVPQVAKIWKQGGRDLSYGMLFLYLSGVTLWLLYGILLHAPSVIFANVATGVLVFVATILKVWTARRPSPSASIAGQTAPGRTQ